MKLLEDIYQGILPAVDKLATQSATRFQCIIMLFTSRMYPEFKLFHDRWIESIGKEIDHHYYKSIVNLPNENVPITKLDATERFARDEVIALKGVLVTKCAEQQKTYLRGLTWPILVSYGKFSTCYLIYILCKHVPIDTDYLFGLIFQLVRPTKCYKFGRFLLYQSMDSSDFMASLFASYHVLWRSIRHFAKLPLRMSMFIFMTHPERDIERVYSIVESRRKNSASLKEDCDRSLDCVSSTVGKIFTCKPEDGAKFIDEFNFSTLMLESNMYYRINFESKTIYKLRANRTREARVRLKRLTALVTIICYSTFACLFLALFPCIMLTILSDLSYVEMYPNCDSELDQLHREQRISQWSSSLIGTNNPLRLINAIFDLLDNFILWIDGACSVMIVAPMAYIVSFDIFVYWEGLHANLVKLLDLYRQEHLDRVELGLNLPLSLYRQSLTLENHGGKIRPRLNDHKLPTKQERRLARLIYETQQEMSDFFKQAEDANNVITDILTFTVCVWLFSYTLINYYSLKIKSLATGEWVIQSLGFSLVSALALLLLNLYRCTRKSYPILCSLMALDRSEYKQNYTKLLEYYTDRRKHTFSIFRSYPYLPQTYMTFLGWTLSCSMIVNNLYTTLQRAPGAIAARYN